MKIYGLEDFALNDTDLAHQYADTIFHISTSFSYYPDVESLKPLPREQRRSIVCKYLRDQFKVVKNHYPTSDYQINGTRFKPWGIKGRLTGKQLAELQSNDKIIYMTVEQVEGLAKIENQASVEPESCPLPSFYCVKGLFIAQFDGLDSTREKQLTEEQIVLVKALSWNDAIKKALVYFDRYCQGEIFSSSYHFTSWKFLKILDVYDLGITVLDPEGTEVYSIWNRRKLRESDYDQSHYKPS